MRILSMPRKYSGLVVMKVPMLMISSCCRTVWIGSNGKHRSYKMRFMSLGDIGLSITSSSLPHTLIVSCHTHTHSIIGLSIEMSISSGRCGQPGLMRPVGHAESGHHVAARSDEARGPRWVMWQPTLSKMLQHKISLYNFITEPVLEAIKYNVGFFHCRAGPPASMTCNWVVIVENLMNCRCV